MKISVVFAGLSFLGMASAASAATFVVNDVEYPNLVNIDLQGTIDGFGPVSGEQGGGPIFLTGQVNGVGAEQTVFGYCDDIPHHISGGGGQDIVYSIGPITQNNAGNNPATNPTLSAQVVANMSGLANLGYAAWKSGDNADAGVIQGAIWIEEYGITASSYDQDYGSYSAAYLENRLNYYLGLSFPTTGGPSLPQLLNTDAQGEIAVQGQIPDGLAVPEPAAWATMTLGFFGLGGLARRRRTVLAA